MKRSKIKVKNADFYLSNGNNISPIGKVTGEFYLLDETPINGKYKVSKFSIPLPILDNTRGYIMACDLDAFTNKFTMI